MKDLFKNLRKLELERARKWFQKLNIPDQKNISIILGDLENWINCKIDSNGNYINNNSFSESIGNKNFINGFFTLYAIASSITTKLNPSDIDLMLVTDFFPNDCRRPQEFKELIKAFTKNYNVDIDDKVSMRYDWESDARIKIDLDNVSLKCKSVDLIYQYDVLSEERWEFNDKFDRLPLFRFGESNGSLRESYDYTRGKGWEEKPSICFRKNPCNYW